MQGYLIQKLSEYCHGNQLIVDRQLGAGKDGQVFITRQETAIKAYNSRNRYLRELSAYRRLLEHEVVDVLGFNVPVFIDSDDELEVLEMTVVKPPYLLDFAQSALDTKPDFPEETMLLWFEQIKEEFESSAPVAFNVYNYLIRHYGIYHLDLSPRNLNFKGYHESE